MLGHAVLVGRGGELTVCGIIEDDEAGIDVGFVSVVLILDGVGMTS